ncbi:MAG: response regulator transcription factor [Candidatus Obscuribacterales bacterium]|nr:response regulator transcription factor [Candidatus Obscuribacterales bacterium]
MPKILLADDDEKLLHTVADWLSTQGFTVETAGDGAAAAILMRSVDYDVIVVDWEMPGKSGPEVCKEYRDARGETPILMLTAKGAIEEKEKGFLSGADDYLTKPFHPKELLLRIRSLLGRRVQSNKNSYEFASLKLDLVKNAVFHGEERLKLTANEYSLLDFLIRNPEKCFSTESLISKIWKSDKAVTDQAVRVCIARLRTKLESYNCKTTIVADPGFGYKLTDKSV